MNKASQHLMAHPYWSLMRLKTGGNHALTATVEGNTELRQQFWCNILYGFDRISRSSPYCFGKVVKLADNERTRTEAEAVLQPELGNAPFVEALRGISHVDSFHRFIESLAGCTLGIPTLLHGALRKDNRNPFPFNLDINGDDYECLQRALAYCQVIETAAEQMVHDMMEMAAQWMVLTGLKSKDIWWPFVAEHILSEGSTSADQHIAIVERMLEPYPETARSPKFAEYQMRYAELAREHLDYVMTLLHSEVR